MALDFSGDLYVADYGNNRVLEYKTPLTTGTTAELVLGQTDFVSRNCDNVGVTSSSLCNPFSVATDAVGDLYVADYNNNRVLEYDAPLSNGAAAHTVFGQGGSLTSETCNFDAPERQRGRPVLTVWRCVGQLQQSLRRRFIEQSRARVRQSVGPSHADPNRDGGGDTDRHCNRHGWRDCDRDEDCNSNCDFNEDRDCNRDTYRDLDRHRNGHRDEDCDCNRDGYVYCDGYVHRDGDGNGDGHRNYNADCDGYIHRDSNCYAYCDADHLDVGDGIARVQQRRGRSDGYEEPDGHQYWRDAIRWSSRARYRPTRSSIH